MTTLLLPCAGRSSRYPGVRPKWMLTTPNGRLAIEMAAASVDAEAVQRCVIAIRRDHDEHYGAAEALRRAFGRKLEILVLERDTRGPAETVSLMIERADIEGPIDVKDADSFFPARKLAPDNGIALLDLRRNLGLTRVGAKSFALLNEQNHVAAIVEKSVASNYVSAGLYRFARAGDFRAWYGAVADLMASEIFVSHVISEGLRRGQLFSAQLVDDVVDVGTLADWKAYIDSRQLLLVDIDGVVFENQSAYFPPYWGDPVVPIEANVAHLRRLQSEGATLVFVTSRPERWREATRTALEAQGLVPWQILMGCPHAPRTLVNDFAGSNPYPSARAINIARNSAELAAFMS